MNFNNVTETIGWLKKNINIHNTQLPENLLNMINNCTPNNISDEFLSFSLIVYAVKKDLYKENINNEELKNLLSNKEATMFIFHLFFSFMLEKLRRFEIISFEPFNIFVEEDLDSILITIIGEGKFIEEELKGKTITYKEFIEKSF